MLFIERQPVFPQVRRFSDEISGLVPGEPAELSFVQGSDELVGSANIRAAVFDDLMPYLSLYELGFHFTLK
ncbi:hypothetical protein B0T36_24540 [Nocardia donostiensis]|nr:hypothetical protein B0T36_24540 [Nocardia donostiensis]